MNKKAKITANEEVTNCAKNIYLTDEFKLSLFPFYSTSVRMLILCTSKNFSSSSSVVFLVTREHFM